MINLEVYDPEFLDWLEHIKIANRVPKSEDALVGGEFYDSPITTRVGNPVLNRLKSSWGLLVSPVALSEEIYGCCDEYTLASLNACVWNMRKRIKVPILYKQGVGYGLGISELRLGGGLYFPLVAAIFSGCKKEEPISMEDLCTKLYGAESDPASKFSVRVAISNINKVSLNEVGSSIINLNGRGVCDVRYGFANFDWKAGR